MGKSGQYSLPPEPVAIQPSSIEGALERVKGFLEPYFPLFATKRSVYSVVIKRGEM